jgi:hypothetical protein|tara:strand:- start:897 stop:1133 length:237 start_codon:yes stop_codon:yes gene_type:complete
MSPEIALLSETWELVKTHVNTKDRLHVAESMLRLFEENIDIGDIDIYKNEFDKVMKTAIVTYFDEGVDDEDEDEEYEY